MQTKPTNGLGIDYFRRGHWLTKVQERFSYHARRKMFQHWLDFAVPQTGESILDVGATPDCERLDSNCMIPWFQNLKMSVTLFSPEPIVHLKNFFNDIHIMQHTEDLGRRIPCGNKNFDWISSSAVLEHVGSAIQQQQFLSECARVGRGLFFTTPNRFHWLEFHTKLPFLHWLPKSMHRKLLRLIGLRFWAQESNLNLLSRNDLAKLAEGVLGLDFEWRVQPVWALGMVSNFVLLAKPKKIEARGRPGKRSIAETPSTTRMSSAWR